MLRKVIYKLGEEGCSEKLAKILYAEMMASLEAVSDHNSKIDSEQKELYLKCPPVYLSEAFGKKTLLINHNLLLNAVSQSIGENLLLSYDLSMLHKLDIDQSHQLLLLLFHLDFEHSLIRIVRNKQVFYRVQKNNKSVVTENMGSRSIFKLNDVHFRALSYAVTEDYFTRYGLDIEPIANYLDLYFPDVTQEAFGVYAVKNWQSSNEFVNLRMAI
jgi:hypothetical protein